MTSYDAPSLKTVPDLYRANRAPNLIEALAHGGAGHEPPLKLVPAPAPAVGRAPRARRKARNPHRGVCLIKPSGAKAPYWRVRYRDPNTGKQRFERVPEAAARTAEARKAYAIDVLKRLTGAASDLATGTTERFEDGPLDEALFERYFGSFGTRLRPETRKAYRRGVRAFLRWCALPGVRITKRYQITQAALRGFAAHVVGRASDNGAPRKSGTANNDLKWSAAVLGELAAMGTLPINRTQVHAALRPIRDTDWTKGRFLRSSVLNEILAACRRHDAERYPGAFAGRMLPTILFLLLTGLRPKEALAIEWRDVITDDDGLRIHVRAEVAKNRRERVIYLAHSPLLAHLVSAPKGRVGRVLGGSSDALDDARWRLSAKHGGPAFDCRDLRRTTGTYLTCSPSIFGAAATFMASAQLGHAEHIARKHYTGVTRISPEARTTEDAMALGVTSESVRPL